MRCDQCNKFVSFDTESDPEVESETMQGTNAEVEVRITNNCAECGQEMKEARFQFEYDFSEEIKAHHEASQEKCGNAEVSLSVEATRTDRRQTKDRYGKPIARARYQKQFYGVDVTLTINCDVCDQEIAKVNLNDEMQASSMDELI